MSRLKQSDGLSCPYCGGASGAVASEAAGGIWQRILDWNGSTFETDLDKLKLRKPKSARCLDCGKMVLNPHNEK